MSEIVDTPPLDESKTLYDDHDNPFIREPIGNNWVEYVRSGLPDEQDRSVVVPTKSLIGDKALRVLQEEDAQRNRFPSLDT